MMVLAARTFADHHNGHDAAGLHLPAQHGAAQDINKVLPALADAPCKTGRRFGVGPFASSFRSGRVPPSLAIRMARGAAPNLPASLASLFNNLRNDRSDLSRFPVWRASRCLPVKKFLKRKHQLLGGSGASLVHVVGPFLCGSFDGSTKPRMHLNDRQILFAESTKARTHD